MKKLIVGAVLAAGLGLAGSAGVAAAAPPGQVDCSNPCVNKTVQAKEAAAEAEPATPPWNAFFAADPWGKFFDSTDGDPTNGKGAWESGVEAVNGGSWEATFGEAP